MPPLFGEGVLDGYVVVGGDTLLLAERVLTMASCTVLCGIFGIVGTGKGVAGVVGSVRGVYGVAGGGLVIAC